MKRLVVVPPHVAQQHKARDTRDDHGSRGIRDIRTAPRRPACESKVIHLRAWTGHNVLRFPRPNGPTSAA